MVSVALRQAIEPLLRVPGAVVIGDDGVKGAVLLALEADVVTGRADECTPYGQRRCQVAKAPAGEVIVHQRALSAPRQATAT